MIALTKTNMMQKIETTNENMDLLNIQQLANMAYAGVYFENLSRGIKREFMPEEIRTRIIKMVQKKQSCKII